jgi:alkanesulfonate monooxygenase SsuD/methylene tetrahydromethanopterin reductase-like flavin-dependent oxidoreductase (luciferase family)
MKFGVHYELQLPTPWPEGDATRIFREGLEHVVLADTVGFDNMWAVEHHFTDDHSLSSSPSTWLPAVAAVTKNIRIGHGICCTPPGFVHPARLAEHITTLDQISNGRVEFGTGESASRIELEGFGVDFATKRQAWEETTREISNMMAMTPYPGFDGQFFKMPCRNLVPKSVQKPHPPIWVAGKPDLAGRHGLGCLGFSALNGVQAKRAVDLYHQTLIDECVPLGHAINPNIATITPLHVHRDSAVARERAEHLKFFIFSITEMYLQGEIRPGRQRGWEAFEKIRPQLPAMGEGYNAIGSPDEVRAYLRILEEAGVDQVLLLHQGGKMPHEWNCESLELFAREIMPEFQDRHEARERKKMERLAPHLEQAMARKAWPKPMPDADIPVVRPYGYSSIMPTKEQIEEVQKGVSAETKGALGIG